MSEMLEVEPEIKAAIDGWRQSRAAYISVTDQQRLEQALQAVWSARPALADDAKVGELEMLSADKVMAYGAFVRALETGTPDEQLATLKDFNEAHAAFRAALSALRRNP